MNRVHAEALDVLISSFGAMSPLNSHREEAGRKTHVRSDVFNWSTVPSGYDARPIRFYVAAPGARVTRARVRLCSYLRHVDLTPLGLITRLGGWPATRGAPFSSPLSGRLLVSEFRAVGITNERANDVSRRETLLVRECGEHRKLVVGHSYLKRVRSLTRRHVANVVPSECRVKAPKRQSHGSEVVGGVVRQ